MAIYEQFTNVKQWEEYLKNLLKNSDEALLKSVVTIYERQTEEEKYSHESKEGNGIGFSRIDAFELTLIALKIKQGRKLSYSEYTLIKNKMPKYWRQLMIISKEKLEKKKQQQLEAVGSPESEENIVQGQIPLEENKIDLKAFKGFLETLRRCAENGEACKFKSANKNICNSCPVVIEYDLKLNFDNVYNIAEELETIENNYTEVYEIERTETEMRKGNNNGGKAEAEGN